MHVVSKAEAAEIGSHLLQLLVILTAVEVREVDLIAAAGAHPPHSGTLEKHSKFPRYKVTCRGKHDTT